MTSFEPFRLDVANQCLWRGETRISLDAEAVRGSAVSGRTRGTSGHARPAARGRLARYLRAARSAPALHPRDSSGARRSRLKHPDSSRRFPSAATSSSHPSPSTTDRADHAAPVAEAVSTATPTLVGRAIGAGRPRSLPEDGDGRPPAAGRSSWVSRGSGRRACWTHFSAPAVGVAGVSVARGQSVEGFGGKEPYYPLLEALRSARTRTGARIAVVDTLASTRPHLADPVSVPGAGRTAGGRSSAKSSARHASAWFASSARRSRS